MKAVPAATPVAIPGLPASSVTETTALLLDPQMHEAIDVVDFSIAKNTAIRERVSLQFRAEAFNILNHPNFTQPQNSLTATTFGQITATRTARGDLGSSRQLQLGLKLIF